MHVWVHTQGRCSCLAPTLGWMIESRWDSLGANRFHLVPKAILADCWRVEGTLLSKIVTERPPSEGADGTPAPVLGALIPFGHRRIAGNFDRFRLLEGCWRTARNVILR